jgi:hypothetical protein
MVGQSTNIEGIASTELLTAVSTATVLKLTLILGGVTEREITACAVGPLILACSCGRARGFPSWGQANVLATVQRDNIAKANGPVKKRRTLNDPTEEKFERESSVFDVASLGRWHY